MNFSYLILIYLFYLITFDALHARFAEVTGWTVASGSVVDDGALSRRGAVARVNATVVLTGEIG